MSKYYNDEYTVIYNDDNIEVLKGLKESSVNLIYCDILYNTGKTFDDYKDSLGTPLEAVEWYKPRIEQMRRVLDKNGSIFIHCNWRLDSYMRILMDEIFGVNCFRNRIYRKHSNERGFYSNFDSQIDIILYYVKDENEFVFNEIKSTNLRYIPLFENGYIESRSDSRFVNGQEINMKEINKHWLVSTKQFIDMIWKDEVVLLEGKPYRKTYVKPIGNLWNEEEMLDTYSRAELAEAYDTPKPNVVLERIISMCSNKGDTVADFFMGGGTTAVVAKRLGRKFIGCDISEKACKVTLNKLRRLNENDGNYINSI